MLSVALTGNVASGKSSVASRWVAAGVPVIDADQLAREAVRPGSDGFEAVRQAFGAEVVGADGALDRARLREIVFSDERRRTDLEGILHPIIWKLRAQWLRERRGEGHELVVSEIPLLFETGRDRDFDVTVLVHACERVRLARLVELRGLSHEDAGRLIASQMSSEEKRLRADHVIENEGSVEELEAAADDLLSLLRTRAAGVVRIDMHLHTAGSFDCLSDPERVLRTALSLGYERVAMTDHNRLGVALRMAEAHPDRVIPGEEVRTREGVDMIGLYLREEIPEGTGAHETIERIRDQGGIVYYPHPYARGKGGGGRLADELGPLCDVIEVFNARLHATRDNERAGALADRVGKLRGAGSDAHTLGELGNAFVELPRHENRPDALLAALRHARTGGSEASRVVHLASTWAKVRKKLPGARAG